MQISIKSNINVLANHIKNIEKQINFISAKALSDIAIDVQKGVTRQLKKDLKSPTPFTMRAIRYKRATKRNLMAIVYIAKVQESYLKYQVIGGVKRPKSKAIVIPKNIRLNKYGNMPRKKVKTLLAKQNTFSGTVKGVAGIWQRGVRNKKGRFGQSKVKRNTAVKLLAAYEPNVNYKAQFDFYGRAKTTANKVANKRINEAIKFALLTAK